MIGMTQAELRALAGYKATELADDVFAVSYLLGDDKLDGAAQRLVTLRRNTDLLAGMLAQLLPVVKAGDAPRKEA